MSHEGQTRIPLEAFSGSADAAKQRDETVDEQMGSVSLSPNGPSTSQREALAHAASHRQRARQLRAAGDKAAAIIHRALLINMKRQASG